MRCHVVSARAKDAEPALLGADASVARMRKRCGCHAVCHIGNACDPRKMSGRDVSNSRIICGVINKHFIIRLFLVINNKWSRSKPSMFLGLVVQMSFYDDMGPTSYAGRNCDIHIKSAE